MTQNNIITAPDCPWPGTTCEYCPRHAECREEALQALADDQYDDMVARGDV